MNIGDKVTVRRTVCIDDGYIFGTLTSTPHYGIIEEIESEFGLVKVKFGTVFHTFCVSANLAENRISNLVLV